MAISESIPIITRDGARGTLAPDSRGRANGSQTLVQFDTGQRAFVPTEALVLQGDGRYYYLPMNLAELQPEEADTAERRARPAATAAGWQEQEPFETQVLPVIEEGLEVGKRTVETGRVRIHKQVSEREELVDEPLLEETVEVERVAINRPIDRPAEVRHEGDTMIIPVMEEVLVVEKRLMLKEELRITRRQAEINRPQRVTLRREDIAVDRSDPIEPEEGSQERTA